MLDIIHLLPDSIANQIAAGEVVQRPASVVKELLENSIDAHAQNIQLILKDAGRTLIQVIDDGIGMSLTDARMSFERHATSKIRSTDDLFQIRTMGFRGEALASIAAVAQVELRTRREEDEIGVLLKIEGSEFKAQEAFACQKGCNIQIKSLFYNVPARRNFLKTNPIEMKHILDEFQRIALAHPDISLVLYHNDVEVFNLPSVKLAKRIVDVFGKNYREQLAGCQEETSFVNVSGYVGKPELAKKNRGEQFFFVNNRYIKNHYLHHAVMSAFEATIPAGSSPFYVLFLEIDPSHIDVNIHPTKTEIKFDDERSVYAIVRSAVRKAIGVYNLTPSIDFESDINFANLAPISRQANLSSYKAAINDFRKDTSFERPMNKTQDWQQLFEGLHQRKLSEFNPANGFEKKESPPLTMGSKVNSISSAGMALNQEINAIQLMNRFLVAQIQQSTLLIDQQRAYERILYEKYYTGLQNKSVFSQQLLFPKTLTLQAADYQLMLAIADEIKGLGFMYDDLGGNSIVIHGLPAEIQDTNEREIIEDLLEQFKNNQAELKLDNSENLARSFAKRTARKNVGELSKMEINLLIHQLFETKIPNYTPNGEPIMSVLSLDRLMQLINSV